MWTKFICFSPREKSRKIFDFSLRTLSTHMMNYIYYPYFRFCEILVKHVFFTGIKASSFISLHLHFLHCISTLILCLSLIFFQSQTFHLLSIREIWLTIIWKSLNFVNLVKFHLKECKRLVDWNCKQLSESLTIDSSWRHAWVPCAINACSQQPVHPFRDRGTK